MIQWIKDNPEYLIPVWLVFSFMVLWVGTKIWPDK